MTYFLKSFTWSRSCRFYDPHVKSLYSMGKLRSKSSHRSNFMNVTVKIQPCRVSSSSGSNSISTIKEHQPSPTAPREVPTPLAFIYSSEFDIESKKGWDEFSLYFFKDIRRQFSMQFFAKSFAEKGFSCLEIDLALPPSRAYTTSEEMMDNSANGMFKFCSTFREVPFTRFLNSTQSYIV